MAQSTVQLPMREPDCQCCHGEGMHSLLLSSAGATPNDRDIECTICWGSGEFPLPVQPNTCAGYRRLRGTWR